MNQEDLKTFLRNLVTENQAVLNELRKLDENVMVVTPRQSAVFLISECDDVAVFYSSDGGVYLLQLKRVAVAV